MQIMNEFKIFHFKDYGFYKRAELKLRLLQVSSVVWFDSLSLAHLLEFANETIFDVNRGRLNDCGPIEPIVVAVKRLQV